MDGIHACGWVVVEVEDGPTLVPLDQPARVAGVLREFAPVAA